MLKPLANMTLLALALARALLPAPARAQEGKAIRVGAGGDYVTLAEALAVARPGATLEILPGVQTGHWTIGVSVALTSGGSAAVQVVGNSVALVDPTTHDEFRLTIAYERTERRGPVFERLREDVDAIAALTGMTGVFTLKGADVYRVVALDEVAGLRGES